MKQKKCPYISPLLNCLSTGKGDIRCLSEDFHSKCEHREYADKRLGIKRDETENKRRRMEV